ncbi:MAG: ATP-dependent helicase RecG, partial [Actinomycetia bacterium]|nr:ATP-dependent helicase RecG [Actinomycetes bacterium]
MPTFDSPLKSLVGDTTAKALAKGLDLHTLGGLLRHYPRRYAERGEHTDIGSLQVGEQVTISAQVIRVNQRPMRNRPGKLLEVVVG